MLYVIKAPELQIGMKFVLSIKYQPLIITQVSSVFIYLFV